MASMAENIRALRIKNNMTMEELGNIVGVQKSAIRKYESGMVENIPRSSIKKMADAFGVSPSFLMGWTEEEKIPSAAEPKLNEGEEALLNLFRLIPEDKQQMVLEMIRVALGTQG